MTSEPEMSIIDGREALGYVLIRPGEGNTAIPEVGMNGISRENMARILRTVADRLDDLRLRDALRDMPASPVPTQETKP